MPCECPEGSPQNAPEALCYVVSTVGLHVMAQEARCTLPGSCPGIAEGTRTVPGGPLAKSAKARGVIDTIVECVGALLPSCPGMRGGGESCPCATVREGRRSSECLDSPALLLKRECRFAKWAFPPTLPSLVLTWCRDFKFMSSGCCLYVACGCCRLRAAGNACQRRRGSARSPAVAQFTA
jgi:hypothetical protein